MKRWELLLLGLAISALAILPVMASGQSTKIHISAPSKSLSWFPIHLTREKGFYRAEGLDVDYVIMRPQIAMQALIAGDVGYTTALGSTLRAAFRNVPVRVVMTIADKPLFALMARPGISSVEELRETSGRFVFRREHGYLRSGAAATLQTRSQSRRKDSRSRRRHRPYRGDGDRRYRRGLN